MRYPKQFKHEMLIWLVTHRQIYRVPPQQQGRVRLDKGRSGAT